MTTMPSLFVSHGAPTFAIHPGRHGQQLSTLGQSLMRPRGIVVISPHWMAASIQITANVKPGTIHDFYGFPPALYKLSYPAPGSPDLAGEVQERLQSRGLQASLNNTRGLDHGVWVPLLHLYPDADIPTIQVSLPIDIDESAAFELGQALRPLTQIGVLIIGSGGLTHNLQDYKFSDADSPPESYAIEFSRWVRQAVTQGDVGRLIQALSHAPHADRSHPTAEHFMPLLVAAGAAPCPSPVTVLNGGIQHACLAMESYVFGQNLSIFDEDNG